MTVIIRVKKPGSKLTTVGIVKMDDLKRVVDEYKLIGWEVIY